MTLQEYRELEQLLGAPDHRLAFAICATADISERDQVRTRAALS